MILLLHDRRQVINDHGVPLQSQRLYLKSIPQQKLGSVVFMHVFPDPGHRNIWV